VCLFILKNMQYNNHIDKQDIVSHINDLVNADNNSFPMQQKTRMSNMALREIWQTIFESYGGWRYDDNNHTTDYPIADTTLTLNQHDYTLPPEAITIRGVEVKDLNGHWHKLTPVTEEGIRQWGVAERELTLENGMPQFYLPDSDGLRIYPKANYTQSLSLRVSFDRDNISFTSTDTIKSPGFDSRYHDLVAIGAARNYAVAKRLDQLSSLDMLWQKGLKNVIDTYTRRYQELFPQKIHVNDALREFR
jgi:hypothetical protein